MYPPVPGCALPGNFDSPSRGKSATLKRLSRKSDTPANKTCSQGPNNSLSRSKSSRPIPLATPPGVGLHSRKLGRHPGCSGPQALAADRSRRPWCPGRSWCRQSRASPQRTSSASPCSPTAGRASPTATAAGPWGWTPPGWWPGGRWCWSLGRRSGRCRTARRSGRSTPGCRRRATPAAAPVPALPPAPRRSATRPGARRAGRNGAHPFRQWRFPPWAPGRRSCPAWGRSASWPGSGRPSTAPEPARTPPAPPPRRATGGSAPGWGPPGPRRWPPGCTADPRRTAPGRRPRPPGEWPLGTVRQPRPPPGRRFPPPPPPRTAATAVPCPPGFPGTPARTPSPAGGPRTDSRTGTAPPAPRRCRRRSPPGRWPPCSGGAGRRWNIPGHTR